MFGDVLVFIEVLREAACDVAEEMKGPYQDN
jgi:hypothetical protein